MQIVGFSHAAAHMKYEVRIINGPVVLTKLHVADQRLCFRYKVSTIRLLPKSL